MDDEDSQAIVNQLTERFCYYRTVVSNSSHYRPANYPGMESGFEVAMTGEWKGRGRGRRGEREGGGG